MPWHGTPLRALPVGSEAAQPRFDLGRVQAGEIMVLGERDVRCDRPAQRRLQLAQERARGEDQQAAELARSQGCIQVLGDVLREQPLLPAVRVRAGFEAVGIAASVLGSAPGAPGVCASARSPAVVARTNRHGFPHCTQPRVPASGLAPRPEALVLPRRHISTERGSVSPLPTCRQCIFAWPGLVGEAPALREHFLSKPDTGGGERVRRMRAGRVPGQRPFSPVGVPRVASTRRRTSAAGPGQTPRLRVRSDRSRRHGGCLAAP